MSDQERKGAERMLGLIIRGFANEGQVLVAMAAKKIGDQLLEQNADSDCVFPEAAALPAAPIGPTVRAKA